MGYTCDVCQNGQPAVYCFADAAVMCRSCDQKVHNANKLAQKHERVALKPQAEGSQCDICQEEQAIMFCSEDRALICRRCDLMIHTANEFTKIHHRHLLSGYAAGLHPLPVGSVVEAPALPHRSTRSATAQQQQGHQPFGGGRDVSNGSSPATSAHLHSASAAQAVPMQHGNGAVDGPADCFAEGTGDAAMGLKQSASLGSLIDVGASLSNRREALTGQALGGGFDAAALRQSNGASGSGRALQDSSGAGASDSAAAAATAFAADAERGMSMTLAADLLGMPSLPGEFNAKDIDAVYFGDGAVNDLEDWSNFLEVPDFMASFSSSEAQAELPIAPAFDQPVVSVRDPAGLVAGGVVKSKAASLRGGGMPSSSGSAGGSPAPDGVVPEVVPALKKQRV